MVLKRTLFIALVLICACQSQSTFYTLDPTIEQELQLNKAESKLSEFMSESAAYYMFSNKDMESFRTQSEAANFNAAQMLDSLKLLVPNVCHCQLKNDTITVIGGVFYGGGIGYQLKITKDSFQGKVVVSGGSDSYKLTPESEFESELLVPSVEQTISFSQTPRFQLGQTITAKVRLTSQEYYAKDGLDLVEDRMLMKILFSCELYPHEGF